MALDIKQLFLDKFIAFNLDRYSDNADVLPLIQGLTLSDVVIGSVADVNGEAGRKIVSLVSSTRRFTANEQKFTRADYHNPIVSTATNAGSALPDAAALAEVEVPGLYLYMDGAETKLAVVVPYGTDPADVNTTAIAALVSGCLYTILPASITVTDEVATIDTDYIFGEVLVAVAVRETFNFPATDYGKLGE